MMIRSPVLPDERQPIAPSKFIYLDNAATTPLCPQAADQLRHGLDLYGNPSSRHSLGQASYEALDAARVQVATLLGCVPGEVVFTGGGSEAISLALQGTFALLRWRGHLVTTAIEHSAVLETASALQRRGVQVTVVPPGPSGHVDAARIAAAVRPETVLVSVMHANNETGAVQPIEQITDLVQAAGKLMHIDAVQTAGKLPINHLRADMVSISAHKFGGPKGVGALRVADHHTLEPLVRGGRQEAGRRAGTENVPGVLGMAAAACAVMQHLDDVSYRRQRWNLRLRLLRALGVLDGVYVNSVEPVLAETISVSFAGVRGDTLADVLDMHGICVSTGSACHAGDDTPSHVLTAMGIDGGRARSTVRFSFSHCTTSADVDAAAQATVAAVRQLRRVSGARLAAGVGSRS